MNLPDRLKAFFLSIFTLMFRFLPNSDPQQPPTPPPPPPPPSAAGDLETAAVEQKPQPASPVFAGQQNLDWTKIILAFCFASAVDIAILSVQINSKLPLTFHLLSLAISFTFASIFVAKFTTAKYPVTALVLNQMGVLFAATAFFLAVTIPFPLSLKVYHLDPLRCLYARCYTLQS
ncbi:hypothetical protein L1049_027954 [Liquidambar formosana]|uniref:PGG domain-containing protein n=1 Tax=Liquidambar formosana TaxID=63359 RepID=A0AAP0RJB3_LIQFO